MNPSASHRDEGCTHFVFLIHGTWGRDAGGWYQTSASGENFATRLAARLVGTALEGALSQTTTVFEWSGANTHEARLTAAQELATLLLRIRAERPAERVCFHFVAHSHGGNVLLAALPRYLTLLPPLTLNALGFPTLVTDEATTGQFFAAVDRLYGLKGFHPDNEAVKQDPELRVEVQAWYADASRAHERYRSGRLTLKEQFGLNRLMPRLARALLRFGTYPSEHGIASVVFLGTPFYYKHWRSGWRRRTLSRIWNAAGEGSVAGLVAYALLLAGGALASSLLSVPWSGVSPFGWHVFAKGVVGLAMAWGLFTGWRRSLGSGDTNVYFDQTLFLHEAGVSPLTELKGRTLFDALVITSGYVDEAFLGLSSLPRIGALVPRLVDGLLKPKAWTFVPVPREIGTFRLTIGGRVRRLARTLIRRLMAGIMFLAYPLRRAIYVLLTRPIVMSQGARLALPLSYGLPSDEFLAGSIVVRQDLDVSEIAVRHLDVARDLLNAPVDVRIDRQRFEFLWDERVLAERFATSTAAAQYQQEPAADVKRHLLAIEERLREFFGVAGLRHSLYYENDAVLDVVASYLLRADDGDVDLGRPGGQALSVPSGGPTADRDSFPARGC